MAFLVGGTLYARYALAPAMEGMRTDEKTKLADRVADRMRTLVIAVVAALVASGLFNLYRRAMLPGGLPAGYHLWFGIKMLLALHVIAVSLLFGKVGVEPAKRTRQLTGVAISGLLILAISAHLRLMR
ncbi:MAG: hypothetical protein IT166_05280 [Bryobacterales bacterium]|nr:hypothetical protein [Bryobacterales bacterium]